MSLASRLVNTLFPGSAHNLTPRDESSTDVTVRDGAFEAKTADTHESRSRKAMQAMEEEEEELEGRPPYLHVSPP